MGIGEDEGEGISQSQYLQGEGFVKIQVNINPLKIIYKLTSSSYGCLDKTVQLLISTNSQLQVTGCDTFHFQVLGSIAS